MPEEYSKQCKRRKMKNNVTGGFLIKTNLFSSYTYNFFPAFLCEVSSHELLYSTVGTKDEAVMLGEVNPKTFFRIK